MAMGQTEVIRKTIHDYSTQTPNWGPNRAHFFQGYLNLGFYTSTFTPNRDFKIGSSFDLGLGTIYRYRVSNFMNLGVGLGYIYQKVVLNNKGMVKAWDTQLHSKAKLANNVLSAKPFVRLNLSPKRGDYLGTFIDLGGFVNWNFYPVTSFSDNQADQRYVQKYVFDKEQERIQYGAFLKVGRDWFRLGSNYYLSNWFKSNTTFYMPKYSLSFEFCF